MRRPQQLATLLMAVLLGVISHVRTDDPPEIVVRPRDQVAINGGTISFFCSAIGNPKPQIEWRKNGKRLSPSRYIVQEVAGGSVLRIEPVRALRDEARYECIAVNGVGDAAPAEATLTVIREDSLPNGFPRITVQPEQRAVERGRNAVVACQASGNPQPTITWLKDSIPVDMSNPRYTIQEQGSLQITDSREEDDGRYECVAENSVGTVYSYGAPLYVRVRRVQPQFSVKPEPAYDVPPGSDLNVTCVAVGSPMPVVKWRKGAIDLTPEENLPVGKNVLMLENVQESANYTCLASSKLGTIEFTTQVWVQALPRPPTNVRVSDVTATSVRLAWSYDIGSDMIQYYVVQYKPRSATQEYSELSGITTMYYTIRDLSPFTEYEFHVIAVNNIGRGGPSTPAIISTGETKPGSAPRNIQAQPLSTSTMVIQWTEPEEPNGQVTSYKVYYTTEPLKPINEWKSQIVDNNRLTTLSDLIPMVTYTIRVQAHTSIGPGPLSQPLQVKTWLGVPSQPLNLRSATNSATSVQLSWQRPTQAGENIIGYELYWNDTISNELMHRAIPVAESYTLTGLMPNTNYHVWVAASSKKGEGAATAPLLVKTHQFVPGAPPVDVKGEAVTSRSIRVHWRPPPPDQQNGVISHYKIKLSGVGREAAAPPREVLIDGHARSHVLEGLDRWSEYQITVLAGTIVGDGPPSPPIIIRTDEDVPEEPRKVRPVVINSTTILVEWKPPLEKDVNGIIRGYQLHVQEVNEASDLVNEPMRYDIPDGNATEYNITGLQPDTTYSIQVAALTRKGDGNRSRAKTIRTPGGVPNRPVLSLVVVQEEPTVTVEAKWIRPTQVYGQLLGYRLKYGKKGDVLKSIDLLGDVLYKRLDSLENGGVYEVRIAGKNNIGYGQEAIEIIKTPDGVPTSAPQNVSHKLQAPSQVVLWWDPPAAEHRHGDILNYTVHFRNGTEAHQRNVSLPRTVFSNLLESTNYSFKIQAYTSKGGGPWSATIDFQTPAGVPLKPLNVRGMSNSDTSIEAWWSVVPNRNDIVGYRVFYTTTAVADLDQWQQLDVPVTHSAELLYLDRHTTYAVVVAARTNHSLGHLSDAVSVKVNPDEVPLSLQAQDITTHTMTILWRPPSGKHYPAKYTISHGAVKEFTDSQGEKQVQVIPPRSVTVDAQVNRYTIQDLSPFTSYQVNVSAVPVDESYRPPSKIIVTTAMAAPQPMVKPDFYGVQNDEITVILPRASEEFGPISHYYLIVVPESKALKTPDQYNLEELAPHTKEGPDVPYVAAKFLRITVPVLYVLGNGVASDMAKNYKLEKGRKYRIFLRAVVDTPQKNLYTSSPFSDPLSLDMSPSPSGGPPMRPPGNESDGPNIKEIDNSVDDTNLIWIVVPIILIILGVLFFTMVIIVRSRRRQLSKTPDTTGVTKPLMSELPPHPSDPVEMRRLNFQTPAMITHPPVSIMELAAHIDRLKSNDNLKFSQEYESIEPGQQFTWDNSNMEVNKPKNRYANVIAYDHSRVVLLPTDVPGSDYANANYCDGYRKQNAYIATQGPLPETFGDFWRMVWEQRSATIVMMTKLEERTRIKCDQYWPNRGTEVYGVMHVTLSDVQELATYCIRTFHAQRTGVADRREIRQFQFTAWPDHGVPDHPTPFLMFLRRVRSMNPPDAGPIVVHCSAGVGRTGAFIVIDSMLERIRHEKTVDIYGHVTCLRAQRNYMVQTEDQYIFIHDALLEAVQCGSTEVPARNLYAHIQKLSLPEHGESITGMELEFKKLSSLKTPLAKFVSASLPCNKFKNRLVNILPYETNRVCLQPIRGVEGSDYINASFIDGYRYRNAYIANQGPLAETADDFWRMLWEHNSTIIVMLTKLREMGREKCHQYWPSERSQRYQYFVVDPIAEYNMPQYILREFKVTDARDGQSRTVRQFQYTDWPEQGVPKSGDGFIEFIGQVHKTKEQFGQEGPITVHCSAGVGRTGVFITLSVVLERMQYEGVVDMFQTVRMLRTQRPAMVQTEDQYQFCYRAALEYLGSFDHYAN